MVWSRLFGWLVGSFWFWIQVLIIHAEVREGTGTSMVSCRVTARTEGSSESMSLWGEGLRTHSSAQSGWTIFLHTAENREHENHQF